MMTKEDFDVLEQVKVRYFKAQRLLAEGDKDGFDKELSELRDLLDDIYDRPEEDVKAGTSGGA